MNVNSRVNQPHQIPKGEAEKARDRAKQGRPALLGIPSLVERIWKPPTRRRR
jgi:hypothetical protein